MRTFNFKKTLSGKYTLCGINRINFPEKDNFISIEEDSMLAKNLSQPNGHCLFLLENKNGKRDLKKKRTVKKFNTWLKNYDSTKK